MYTNFDRFFSEWMNATPRAMTTDYSFVPACDVEEAEDHYLLALEVPGVKREDLKLEVMNRQVIVSGERRSNLDRDQRARDERWTYTERRFGKFQRSFALPADVDGDKVEASYQDGILR